LQGVPAQKRDSAGACAAVKPPVKTPGGIDSIDAGLICRTR
jgi:hypothetical protein